MVNRLAPTAFPLVPNFGRHPARGLYGRYMPVLDQLLAHSGHAGKDWTAHDIDTALYWIGSQD